LDKELNSTETSIQGKNLIPQIQCSNRSRDRAMQFATFFIWLQDLILKFTNIAQLLPTLPQTSYRSFAYGLHWGLDPWLWPLTLSPGSAYGSRIYI